MLARLSVLFTFLALLVVVAGCGGGGSSSTVEVNSAATGEGPKDVFIEEADAVCTESRGERRSIEREIEAVESSADSESPQSLRALGVLLNEAVDVAERQLETLRELQPPEEDEATVEKLLATAEEGNGLGAEAASALEEGEASRFNALAKKVAPVNNRAKAMAEGYGLKVCGQAP